MRNLKEPHYGPETVQLVIAAIEGGKGYRALEIRNRYISLLKEKGSLKAEAFAIELNGVTRGSSDPCDRLEASFDFSALPEPPKEATADVSIRRIQGAKVAPNQPVQWKFGEAKGRAKADANGLVTIPGLKITAQPQKLTIKYVR